MTKNKPIKRVHSEQISSEAIKGIVEYERRMIEKKNKRVKDTEKLAEFLISGYEDVLIELGNPHGEEISWDLRSPYGKEMINLSRRIMEFFEEEFRWEWWSDF